MRRGSTINQSEQISIRRNTQLQQFGTQSPKKQEKFNLQTPRKQSLLESHDQSSSKQSQYDQPKQIEQDVSLPPKQLKIQTYKSFATFVLIALILSISSFQFGYALCQVSTVPIKSLISIFDLGMDVGTANGLLVGIMPIGGVFGSALNSLLVRRLKRKQTHYVISIINIASMVLQQITTIQTIFIGRFLLGICCGVYTMIAPQFIQEISPPALKPLFGSFFSLGRIIGIIFCYALGLILRVSNVPSYWRIMFIITGVLSISQTILIYFYVPDTPVQLTQRQQDQDLQKVIRKYYKEQHVRNTILQYQTQHNLQKIRAATQSDLQKSGTDPFAKNKRRAYWMQFHLQNYRQLLGVNTIVAFGGVMMQTVSPGLALYANLLLNGIQGVVTAFATFYVGRKFGRRPLYLSSGVILAICSYLVAIGYLINITGLIITFMFIYMIMFGLLFSPVSWAYPAEIVTAKQLSIGNIFNWVSLALTTLVPPIVIHKMGDNAWAVFMFFGGYITISLFYMFYGLVQTKGKKYQEFIAQF